MAAPPADTDSSASESPPSLQDIDASTRAKWLIDGAVVDTVTGKAIKQFIVTPGTTSLDDATGQTTIRWRDNLKRSMSDGRLQWPRTSGFSVMRFRIDADGYRPIITHEIWRGGPYTRIKVRMDHFQ